MFSLQGWGLIDLPLRASNEGWFIWSISSIWLVGPEIHPEEPDRPVNQTDKPGRVARAQENNRLSSRSPSERPFEELLREGHMLFDVRLQIAGAGLPVVFRIADPAGKADKLF